MNLIKNYALSTATVYLLAGALSSEAKAADWNFNRFNLTTGSLTNLITTADCEQSKKTANELIDKLVAGDFEGVRKNFDENMKEKTSAEQIKIYWNNVVADAGDYKSREKSLYQEYPLNFAVLTRLQMAKSRVLVTVSFSEDGKIMGLFLNPA